VHLTEMLKYAGRPRHAEIRVANIYFQKENDQRLRHTCTEHQGDPKAKHDAQQRLRHCDAGCRGAHAKDGHQTGQMQKGKYIKRGNNGNKRIPSHK